MESGEIQSREEGSSSEDGYGYEYSSAAPGSARVKEEPVAHTGSGSQWGSAILSFRGAVVCHQWVCGAVGREAVGVEAERGIGFCVRWNW